METLCAVDGEWTDNGRSSVGRPRIPSWVPGADDVAEPFVDDEAERTAAVCFDGQAASSHLRPRPPDVGHTGSRRSVLQRYCSIH